MVPFTYIYLSEFVAQYFILCFAVFDHEAKKRKVSLVVLKQIYQQEGV